MTTTDLQSATELEDRLSGLPRLKLGRFPSELREVSLDGKSFFVKNDGSVDSIYGGNKLRKLEYLLADAREKSKNHLVVCGDSASHTVEACSLIGTQAGFSVSAIIYPLDKTCDLKESAFAIQKTGAKVFLCRSFFETIIKREFLKYREGAFTIKLGASSPYSTIGYINAALELWRQFRELDKPFPATIYIPFATGGTVAGLALGLAALGASTKIIAVQTADSIIANKQSLARMLRRTGHLLKLSSQSINKSLSMIDIDSSELGKGYGDITSSALAAVGILKPFGILLEPRFSGKALASMLVALKRYPEVNTLFVNTHNQRAATLMRAKN